MHIFILSISYKLNQQLLCAFISSKNILNAEKLLKHFKRVSPKIESEYFNKNS